MKKTTRILSIAVLITSCLALSDCGFQLRGEKALPPQLHTVYLTGDNPYGPLETELRNTLVATGIKVVDNPQNAPVTLNIISTDLGHTNPTIGTSSQANVYTFTYTLNFELQDSNGKVLLQPQTIATSRNLTLNPNEVLGSSNEILLLEQELQHTMINLLYDHLSSQQTFQAVQPKSKTKHRATESKG